MGSIDLEQYLNDGVNALIKDALRGVFKNPRETVFLTQFALSAKKAEKLRHKAIKNNEHVPSFLIASITDKCNLNCSGCYDRAKENTGKQEMSRHEWQRIFTEAKEIGISAIILAGGEPLLRKDVLEEAARYPSILFPVFTNGTMLDRAFLEFFEKNRHLVPLVSMEGNETSTNERRGKGIYEQTMLAIEKLNSLDLLFGVSITATNQNLDYITRKETIEQLETKGCKVFVFVEYVPFSNPELVLNDDGRSMLEKRLEDLRQEKNLIVISFPGDEKLSGGCLAAGRGFFHVNAYGDAEPCPFSPYSDTSLKTVSIRQALQSPFFTRLHDSGSLLKDHRGGCTLFDQADFVKSLA